MPKTMAIYNAFRDNFVLELLSLIGSSLSLMGMFVVLASYDNHPVFDWHGVTLNAVVSVLSTAFKSFLILAVSEAISQGKWIVFSRARSRLDDFDLIDRASRGPVGCAQAIIRRIGG
jgi:hypothetical protein